MTPETKQTYKEIFIRNGFDPFDVFLLPVADWPREAQEMYYRLQEPKEPTAPPTPGPTSEWEYRAGEGMWGSGVE